MIKFPRARAVLFDLDNTLIVRARSLEKLTHYVNRFFFPEPDYDHEKIAEMFCRCFKSGYDDHKECFNKFISATGSENPPSYEEFLTLWDFYYPYCTTRTPDVESVLELKKMGYRIGILTNGPMIRQNAKIDVAGFRDWFDPIVTTGELGVHKPDPDAFLKMCRIISLSPGEVVYVGDRPRNDIYGPRRVGMSTVWMSAYEEWDEKYERADAEIGSLPELAGLFDTIK